ncbi:MAG TPA: PVC-type heme-binding CxxCH protein [Pirellulales bacterium]|nr:PVC-type heme-binding CxxCH protein [Pirellulales bacterium]
MAILSRCVLFLAALSWCATAFAQRELTDIPPPDPELERKSFQIADGFEVNLFAADPLLAKPIQMNFDPAGRLWVASSEIYPQILPGQKANDRIVVLEDADGDGKADKTHVFAEGLLIPTAVEPGDGGAYVANSTELVHLADTDGDGKADRRRVMLSGFGTEDTHHILHTFRWGHDGMLYFNQSIYIHSHIETPWGVRRLGGGGIWQFRPETMQLEVFCRGFVNPWGHHVDHWGQSFATDGAYGEGINYVFPGATFVTAPGAKRILKGLNPGSPKHCGLELVSGRHLPDDWQGNALTNDFRAHRVCRFVLSEDGSGYASREQQELIKTTHVACRPIDVQMGPDGAIYIADWYNPIIQHGEVDFRDPRRDHVHGRIWRVTAKGRPLVERPKLVGASTEALLEALKAPEEYTRRQAKRVLKERGVEILPQLADWIARLDASQPETEHHRLEALWTYQSIDVVEPRLLYSLLRSQDHRVRAAATRVVYHWRDRLPRPLELLAERIADDHPRVRLEAVRALSQLHSAAAMETALKALERPIDANLDFALWLTSRELAPHWLPALQAGKFDAGGNAAALEFALKAVDSPAVVPPLISLLQAGKVPPQREESVLTLIASLGDPDDLSLVFDLALRSETPAARQAILLSALAKAARQRKVRPQGDLARVGSLLNAPDRALRIAACEAVGAWRLEQLLPNLATLALADDATDAVRNAAAHALAQIGGEASRNTLDRLCDPSRPAATRMIGVEVLAGVDPPAAGIKAVELLSEGPAGWDPAPVIHAFLQRKAGPAALIAALANRKIPADAAKLAVRAARDSARNEEALVDALRKAGGLTGAAPMLTAEQLADFVAEVRKSGDAARGETIFRRQEQGCMKCHAIGGAGGQVGPDLVSIGASAQVDYLVESILLPNKAVKENYHSLVVATDEGQIITGIKIRQTDKELILRNSDDRELSIPLDAIDEQAPGASLMPAGLADSLTHQELVDLVRFLSELGKVGPYSIGNARVVRRWQTVALPPARAPDDAAPWQPVYSQVSGVLPLTALAAGGANRQTYVCCQFDVTTAGPALLHLNSTQGLSAWLDDRAIELADELRLDLSIGRHSLILGVDRTSRSDGLRIELVDLPDSAARVQIVTGK